MSSVSFTILPPNYGSAAEIFETLRREKNIETLEGIEVGGVFDLAARPPEEYPSTVLETIQPTREAAGYPVYSKDGLVAKAQILGAVQGGPHMLVVA